MNRQTFKLSDNWAIRIINLQTIDIRTCIPDRDRFDDQRYANNILNIPCIHTI